MGKDKLLHISFNQGLPSVLKPKQPTGSKFTKRVKRSIYYEDLPPRVSFAPTIQNCFNGIYPNIAKFFEEHNYPYIVMYVYQGLPDATTEILSKSETEKKLWDYKHTKEIVVLSPISIKLLAEIKITNPLNKDGTYPTSGEIYGTAFNDPKNEKKFIAPIVDWRVTKRFDNERFK